MLACTLASSSAFACHCARCCRFTSSANEAQARLQRSLLIMGHSKKKRLQQKQANQGRKVVQDGAAVGQATVSTGEAGASQQDIVDTRAAAPPRPEPSRNQASDTWFVFHPIQCFCRRCRGQIRHWHETGILRCQGPLPPPRCKQTWDALAEFARNLNCATLLGGLAPSTRSKPVRKISHLQPRQRWTHEEWLAFKSAMDAKAAALTAGELCKIW